MQKRKKVSEIEETNEIKKIAKEIYQPEKEGKIPASPKSDPKVKTIQSSRISTEQAR